MRGEDDLLAVETASSAHALGKRREEQWMIVERLHGHEGDPLRQRRNGAVLIFRDAQRRELRSQRDADDAGHAPRGQIGHRLLDERLPVAHADDDGDLGSETMGQRLALRQRQLGQR